MAAPLTKTDMGRVALIVVESIYYGDKRAAERWDITQRTVKRYRARSKIDPELSHLVNLKRQEFEGDWASEIPKAIMAALDFIVRAAQQADPTDPDLIHSIAGAMKIAAEIGIAKEIIDAKVRAIEYSTGHSLPDRSDME